MDNRLGYFTLETPDIDKARAFYGALFGWAFNDDSSKPTYAHVAGSGAVDTDAGAVVGDRGGGWHRLAVAEQRGGPVGSGVVPVLARCRAAEQRPGRGVGVPPRAMSDGLGALSAAP